MPRRGTRRIAFIPGKGSYCFLPLRRRGPGGFGFKVVAVTLNLQASHPEALEGLYPCYVLFHIAYNI